MSRLGGHPQILLPHAGSTPMARPWCGHTACQVAPTGHGHGQGLPPPEICEMSWAGITLKRIELREWREDLDSAHNCVWKLNDIPSLTSVRHQTDTIRDTPGSKALVSTFASCYY